MRRKGKKVHIVEGSWWGNDAVIQDEVPNKEGYITVAINDIITSVPVGVLHTLTAPGFDRPVPGDPITCTRRALHALERLEWVHEDMETYMRDVFMKELNSNLVRIWSLAYFVTELRACRVAGEILEDTGYNIQQFGFKALESALEEYQALPTPPPFVAPAEIAGQ